MPALTTAVRTFTMPKSLNESLAEAGKQVASSADPGRSLDGAKRANEGYSKDQRSPLGADQQHYKRGITFAAQDKLPRLPIPELDASMGKYLAALKPLQSPREYAETQQATEEFLKSEGPELQERLKKYANGKTSYIEQFCMLYDSW
jgi:carnitine O-acetyltransferase